MLERTIDTFDFNDMPYMDSGRSATFDSQVSFSETLFTSSIAIGA
jgi:hypothetical protein